MARTLVKILPVEEVDLTGGGLGGNLEKLQDALFVPVQPDKLTPAESDTTFDFALSVTSEVVEDDATLEEPALPFSICSTFSTLKNGKETTIVSCNRHIFW